MNLGTQTIEREYITVNDHKNDYASKGVGGVGIAGLASGALALVVSGINWLNNQNKEKAKECAVAAGITLADLTAIAQTWSGTNCANNNHNACNENIPLTRWDLQNERLLSEKDAKIAELEADKKTDAKILDLYRYTDGQLKELAELMNAKFAERDRELITFQRETADNFKQIEVYQAKNTTLLSCITKEIENIDSLIGSFTKTVVPSDSVCRTNPERVFITNDPLNVTDIK